MRVDGQLLDPHRAKLAPSRHEASLALGVNAVPINRLTQRGLLRLSRAARRPIYPVRELERFLSETSPADYQPPSADCLLPHRNSSTPNRSEVE